MSEGEHNDQSSDLFLFFRPMRVGHPPEDWFFTFLFFYIFLIFEFEKEREGHSGGAKEGVSRPH